jgi:hypothetical protein
LLPHSPYSLNLAPSDFLLFPNLLVDLILKSKVIAFTETYFSDLDKIFHRDGSKSLEKHLIKLITLEEDYV